jgi:hypothetical protein
VLQQQNKDRVLTFKNNWYKRDKFGIPQNWLDVSVTFSDGSVFTIVGLDTKRKSFPLVLQNSKGELANYQVAGMTVLMQKQHPELSGK